ncbi:MAG: hypothetical protein GX248_04715 [Peptococcaceae bacterium]|nr:hypothetical protein [Peptococcaceae bacterium]
MHWLGKRWSEVQGELTDLKLDFTSQITYPDKKVIPCGDLRVARVSRKKGKLVFVLLHDKYQKY